MDRDTLLKSLAGTLDANPQVRKDSESQLRHFEKQQGFTAYLLDLINEPNVPLGIQASAAIFFKNRVNNYWIFIDDGHRQADIYIKDFEKPSIKEKLIQTLIQTYRVAQLKQQLTTALSKILNVEKWEELLTVIKTLISDQSNVDNVYTGLLCLYEYAKCNRWMSLETGSGSNPIYEDITTELFPTLESLTTSLINSEDNQTSDEMLYLIIKIFKFITFSTLPSYFLNDESKLGNWCHLHILIINKPLPKLVMEEDSSELRSVNPRIKTVKWCFGNLHRLLSRHGGGHATNDKNSAFATKFMSTFVPEILNVYWSIIENWSIKKVWLSEASLYHMISFLEQLIDTPAWPLLEDKLEAIILHVLLPTLSANQETVELYEDDPEEYIRRFFDTNRENNTADVASINFVFRLSSKKFKSTINLILTIINDIMTRRASPQRDDLKTAMEVEGAFRFLSTLSYKLDKKNVSPVAGKIDTILHSFVYPELLEQTISSTPFLTARACDTIAMFVHKFQDQQVLQDIFQAIVRCFQMENQLPIQITAVDALRTLVDDELVADQIAGQAPQLMGTLLDMSKKFESDILTSVMDAFVEKFAKNLEPYAHELALRLSEQFIKLASELLENGNSDNVDMDKEYQAAGILNTLATLVIAMNSSPQVASSLEPVFEGMIKFIFENAMVSFLPEAVEILESVVFSTEQLSPIMWGLYQSCIDSFEIYALEYFDTFQPFFESVINHGFSKEYETIESPHVQSLIGVCFNILKSEAVDPIFADCAFELLEMTVLSMNTRFTPFLPRFLPEIFDVFQSLESENAFDGHMLHHLSILKIFFGALYIEPTFTLNFLNENNFIVPFFQLWFKHSDSFQSVYGCKLQILAGLGILSDATNLNIFEQLQDILRESADLLISNLEVLPHAIKARQEILAKESSVRQFNTNDGGEDDDNEFGDAYDDDYEADEAELEALKQTPIDGVHIFEIFTQKIINLQQDNSKYQALFGDLDASQVEIIKKIVEISQKQQQQNH